MPDFEVTVDNRKIKTTSPQHWSSNIHSAGFPEGEARGPLTVIFKGETGGAGSAGEYLDVPRAIFDALQRSVSPGGFIHKDVIPHFKYRRLKIESVSAIDSALAETTPAISEAGRKE